MSKESRLNDEANIYQQREIKSKKEIFKTLTFKQKLKYFKDYYLKITIILIIAVLCFSKLLFDMLSPKSDSVFHGIIINDSIDTDAKENLITSFGESIKINLDKEDITLEDGMVYGLDDNNANADVTFSTQQKITTYCYANQLDIIIADQKVFEHLAKTGCFANLNDKLPSDLFKELSDYLLMYSNEEDTKDMPYGISLEHSNLYNSLSFNHQNEKNETMVIGIIANAPNEENAATFIRYLFEE